MTSEDFDFLRVEGREFGDIRDFTGYIETEIDFSAFEHNLSLIGSISDFNGTQHFRESLTPYFQILQESGNLLYLRARDKPVTYYAFVDEEYPNFPIFFTNGKKTEELPETIDRYLKEVQDMSRMWIGKRQMEHLRSALVQRYPNVLMTYFTANRSRYSDIAAQRRPNRKRTIQYYGDDALETYRELQNEYGVLPTNIVFELPNIFRFRATQRGVFTLSEGEIDPALNMVETSIDRLSRVKEYIDEGEYQEVSSRFVERQKMNHSKPWAIHLGSGLEADDLRYFTENIRLDDWEFDVSYFDKSFDPLGFDTEVVDDTTHSRTLVRTKGDNQIRVYPRKSTGIDQSIRIFNFVNDHIDPDCRAVEVG